jgi:hypothetical protein
MRTAFFIAFIALAAHGSGQLKLDSKTLTPGQVLHLTGAKFEKNEAFDVLIAGPTGRTQLSHIKSNAKGEFKDSVVIPADLKAGSYRIVLIASDDDEVADADVEVTAAAASTGATNGMADMPGHDMSKMGDASAEPLSLARARSPWVTGGAFLAIGLALVIGAMAVLRPPRSV